MRKLFSLLMLIALVLIGSNSFASVGIKLNGVTVGAATDLNIVCGSGANSSLSVDGSTFNLNCNPNLATTGVANGGGTSLATFDSGIPVTFAIVKKAISNFGTSTDVLPNAIPGQMMTIEITADSGAGTWKITPTTSYGWASITFTAALQEVSLVYLDDTNGWIMLSTGASAATADPTWVAK